MRLRGLAALAAPVLAAAALTLAAAAPAGAATTAHAAPHTIIASGQLADGNGAGWNVTDNGHDVVATTTTFQEVFEEDNSGLSGGYFFLEDFAGHCLTWSGTERVFKMESCTSSQANHFKNSSNSHALFNQACGDNLTANYYGNGAGLACAGGPSNNDNQWHI